MKWGFSFISWSCRITFSLQIVRSRLTHHCSSVHKRGSMRGEEHPGLIWHGKLRWDQRLGERERKGEREITPSCRFPLSPPCDAVSMATTVSWVTPVNVTMASSPLSEQRSRWFTKPDWQNSAWIGIRKESRSRDLSLQRFAALYKVEKIMQSAFQVEFAWHQVGKPSGLLMQSHPASCFCLFQMAHAFESVAQNG